MFCNHNRMESRFDHMAGEWFQCCLDCGDRKKLELGRAFDLSGPLKLVAAVLLCCGLWSVIFMLFEWMRG